MTNDRALQLLRDLDLVECEIRQLEGRLTRIRRAIYESCGGKRSGYEMDGTRTPRATPVDPEQHPDPMYGF